MYLQGNWTVNTSKNAKKWLSLEVTYTVINFVGGALIWVCPETGPVKKDSDDNKE